MEIFINYIKGLSNMIFLAIAWGIMIIFAILEVLRNSDRISKDKKNSIKDFQLLILIFMFFFFFIGIMTKDPLLELICSLTGKVCNIPPSLEWIAYMLILGYLVWKVILVDMKRNLSKLQDESKIIDGRLSKVEGSIEQIKSNTDTLLTHALNKKKAN